MKKTKPDTSVTEQAPPPSRFARLTGFDLGGRGLAASGLSVVTAGALLTGVVPGFDLGNTQPVTEVPELPAFGITPYANGEPIRPDDGLTRVIVTPTTEHLIQTATPLDTPKPEQPSGSITSRPTSTGSPQSPAPSSDDDRSIGDLSELEGLRNAPAGSTLVVTTTGIAVRYPDGTIVPLDDVLTPPTDPAADGDEAVPSERTPTETEPLDPSPGRRQLEALADLPAEATMAEQLASLPGVESVNAIGDGSYSVALSDPAALDGLSVEVVEQTFLTIFGEPYERYEWYIENDGASMQHVSGNLNVALDADIDGTVAIEHATGTGVVVAIVDTGVDFSHPDLAPSKWTNPGEICDNGIDDDTNGYVDDCHGFDFVYRDGTGYNAGAPNHGTHVAGTVAAARNNVGVAGVAPDAELMDLNVSATNGSLAEAAIAEAVRYAANNGADVINMSLGTKPGGAASPSIGAAIDYAATKGVLVVVAAGNDNTDLDLAKVWPASYDKANMMTVGATTTDDSRASFSNHGSALDLYAPGDLLLSTVPGADYLFMSGTSMATPVVAGSAALLLSDDPSLTPPEVIAALQATSDIIPSLDGYGANGARVNAGEALGGPLPDDTPITELAVTMTGLGNLTTTTPLGTSVRFAVPDDEFDEAFRWEMALLSSEAGDVYALVDHPVEVTGRPTTTGESGFLDLGVTGTSQVTIATTLPAGDYGLLFEAVPTADPTTRLGSPFAVSFSVREAATDEAGGTDPPAPGDPGAGDPDTGNPDTGNPDTGNPETGNPGSGRPGRDDPAMPGDPGTNDPGTSTPTAPTTPGGGSGTGSDDGGGTGGNTTTPDPGAPTPDSGSGNSDSDSDSSSGNGNPSPTPTTPPTNGGSGNQPTTPGPTPTPVEQGRYSVQTISPSVGRVGEQTSVALTGDFPDPIQVFFGSVEATSLSQTSSRLVALAPASSQAGPVSIRLVRNGTTVLMVENGFVYQAAGNETYTPPPTNAGSTGGGTGSDTTPPPTPGNPSTGNPTPETPGGGSGGGTGTSPTPGNPGTGDPDTGAPSNTTPTTEAPGNDRARQSRSSFGTERVDLGDGRTGAPVTGDNPLASAPVCRSNRCGARNA